MTKTFREITFREIGGDADDVPTCWCVDAFGEHASGPTLFECCAELQARILRAATDYSQMQRIRDAPRSAATRIGGVDNG